MAVTAEKAELHFVCGVCAYYGDGTCYGYPPAIRWDTRRGAWVQGEALVDEKRRACALFSQQRHAVRMSCQPGETLD